MSKYSTKSLLIFFVLLSSCTSEEPGVQTSTKIGMFYIQFDAAEMDEPKIFNEAKYIIETHGYILDKETDYQIYSKNRSEIYLIFTPSEGTNCFRLSVDTFNKISEPAENEIFLSIKSEMENRFHDEIKYIGSNTCPPYS